MLLFSEGAWCPNDESHVKSVIFPNSEYSNSLCSPGMFIGSSQGFPVSWGGMNGSIGLEVKKLGWSEVDDVDGRWELWR